MNDLYAALTAFIAAYAQPAIDAAQIFNGFQVGSIPPEKSNDFAVFSVISQHRVSMTRETWPSGDEDSAEFAHYAEALVQVDFYSKREFQAQERARTFALFAKSSPGVRFLRQRGIDLLFADDPRNATGAFDSAQYTGRWTVVLHVGFMSRATIGQDFFTEAIPRVANVDIVFPPTTKGHK